MPTFNRRAQQQQAGAQYRSAFQQGGTGKKKPDDERPEAMQQRHMQQMMEESEKNKHLQGVQLMAMHSHRNHAVAQAQALANGHAARQTLPVQRQAQRHSSSLPGGLKSGVERLSGLAMNDVQVHYNSEKPAQLQAYAYAQGSDIHLGPGQERHLPHEAWHVVQQKQGRVQPTRQMKQVGVNDSPALEREADVMGQKALNNATANTRTEAASATNTTNTVQPKSMVVQRVAYPCYIPAANGPHHGVGETFNNIEPRDFTDGQKTAIYNHNAHGTTNTVALLATVDKYTDDGGGNDLVKTASVKPIISEIDHIVPKNKGGGNTMKNAQIIPGNQNASKGDTYPHGYSPHEGGTRVYIHRDNAYLNNGTILPTNYGTQHVRIPNGTNMKQTMYFTMLEAQAAGLPTPTINAGTAMPSPTALGAAPYSTSLDAAQASALGYSHTLNAGTTLTSPITVNRTAFENETGHVLAPFAPVPQLPIGYTLINNLVLDAYQAVAYGITITVTSGQTFGANLHLTYQQADDFGYRWPQGPNLGANLDLPLWVARNKGIAPNYNIPN